MYIIAGLGNPGEKYENTRHNAGFMAVDALAEKLGVMINKRDFRALYTKARVENEQIVLLKPQTYMNLSGESIYAAMFYYKCPIQNLIVMYDDIDLKVGHIRIRRSGSAGSHNGMKSIIASLGMEDFPRIRIGVSKPPPRMDLVDYVLGTFGKEELPVIRREAQSAADAAMTIITKGAEEAMQKYNGLSLLEDE